MRFDEPRSGMGRAHPSRGGQGRRGGWRGEERCRRGRPRRVPRAGGSRLTLDAGDGGSGHGREGEGKVQHGCASRSPTVAAPAPLDRHRAPPGRVGVPPTIQWRRPTLGWRRAPIAGLRKGWGGTALYARCLKNIWVKPTIRFPTAAMLHSFLLSLTRPSHNQQILEHQKSNFEKRT